MAAVKAAWFGSYESNERPDAFDRIVQSWDTANKASELSDFSVCTNWGITAKDLYLLHVLRRRMEHPELKRAVCEQAQAFDTNVKSRALAENPVEVTYDPEELCGRYEAGEAMTDLLRIPPLPAGKTPWAMLASY